MLSIEHLLQFQRANLLQFSSVLFQITARTVSVFDFFVSNSVHQNSIWFLPHLVNIQTKNTKTESFKNVEYKKNEKSRKLRLIFLFSGTAVSESSLFHCCFVRVCVFLVLVFTIPFIVFNCFGSQFITSFATALQWVLQPYDWALLFCCFCCFHLF